MRYIFFFIVLLVALHGSLSAQHKTENLLIVTLDGFRWQELFGGADSSLIHNANYNSNPKITSRYWLSDVSQRREELVPFFWKTISTKGQLYGNRQYGNDVKCANPYWFSYPGYSELMTGIVDRKMSTNRKVENPNINLLEFIHSQPEYHNRVAAFSTWDVIPYVLRSEKNGIYVNRTEDVIHYDSIKQEQNKPFSISYSGTERCDESVFHLAFEYLKTNRPKVMFLSLDGTDHHAHRGHYDRYLEYAHLADAMISELWNWIQSQEGYRDRTTLLITTDHGRGRGNAWKTHGRWAFGSNQTWFAVMGPDTPPLGEMKLNTKFYQKQLAKTLGAYLELDYNVHEAAGKIIEPMFFPKQTIVVNPE